MVMPLCRKFGYRKCFVRKFYHENRRIHIFTIQNNWYNTVVALLPSNTRELLPKPTCQIRPSGQTDTLMILVPSLPRCYGLWVMGPLVEMIVFNSIPHIAGPETVALALKKNTPEKLDFFYRGLFSSEYFCM